MTAVLSPPAADEYHARYAGYVAAVGDADPIALLEAQLDRTAALLAGVDETRALYRYAPEKWSVKEVVGHLIDTERIMVYRALRIARGDATPLPGFEENDYVRGADFDARPLGGAGGLAAELAAVRRATILFFRSLEPAAFERRGTASGWGVSVRALAYITAGHEQHHLRTLRERYGVGA